MRRLSPQPPADSPVWGGHKPGQGAIYVPSCPYKPLAAAVGVDAAADLTAPFWAARQPAAAAVDPVMLARRAVSRMRLSGPDIQSPQPGRTYVVGMPMWMHVGTSPTTYGPNSASATAGAVTVTATAQVTGVEWAMGDGKTVVCTGPGTAYRSAFGKQSSPDCGHLYTRTSAAQPSHTFPVTATATWRIDWQGAGQQGHFTQTRSSQVRVSVGEVQALG
ncbi:ATP/GTP-binding protein [Streptomyces lydicus]|uniref:ATP/GTP-binding protein n=1 Tax=Streptomyces lydicus TaxID=47763 RepID=UPI0036EA1071